MRAADWTSVRREGAVTKAEFDALPLAATPPGPEHRERLMQAARNYRDLCTSQYRSWSGADVAEAYKYDLLADGLGCIGSGKDVGAVVALLSAKWEAYARENNARVKDAPKIKRGPCAGHSVIGHRHVCPDFEHEARHLRAMAEPPSQGELFG